MNMKQWLRDNRGFLVLLLCFGVFRTAIADWSYVGFVPRSLLIARAEGVRVSADITSDWMPRLERFASRLH